MVMVMKVTLNELPIWSKPVNLFFIGSSNRYYVFEYLMTMPCIKLLYKEYFLTLNFTLLELPFRTILQNGIVNHFNLGLEPSITKGNSTAGNPCYHLPFITSITEPHSK